MADVREFAAACEKSKLRPLPHEEHFFFKALADIEKRIQIIPDEDREVEEPYELN